MTDLEIRRVDPTDDASIRKWASTVRDSYLAGQEAMWWESYEAVSEQLRDGSRGKFRAALLAMRDGAVVGAAKLDVRPDQPVEIEIGVLAAHRRRGIGTALAAGLHDRLPQHTSDVLQCEVLTEEGLAFARRWGIEPANVEDRQLLKLPIPDSTLVELERPNSRISTHSWVGPCPERLVDDLARLTEQMEEDVPSGDLTRVVSPTDRKRVRYNEKRLDEEGYDLVRTIAQLDGESVGYTTLFVPRNNPEIIVQDYTLVDRAHRGHGVGRALKIANLRQLAAVPSALQSHWVQTSAAPTNTAMLALNEAIGFRTVDKIFECEGKVEALPTSGRPPAPSNSATTVAP